MTALSLSLPQDLILLSLTKKNDGIFGKTMELQQTGLQVRGLS